MLQPRLIDVEVPARPEGAVILLHGGASRRASMRVSPAQLSVLRMVPIAKRVARVGRGRLAVYRLLNSRRGWDASHTPLQDVAWALERVHEQLSAALPVCLVGHSLGGRAALLALGRPGVRSAVALAPWVYPSDVPAGLSGQRVLFVHGSRDRVASPARSEALAEAMSARADVGYISVRGGKHAMLGRHELFDGLAAEFSAATLLGTPPTGPLARLAAGERYIEV